MDGRTTTRDGTLLDVLRERRSPVRWDPVHELTDADLRLLTEAARWAPSAGNSQPWAFVVGRRGDDTHRVITAALARSTSRWAPQASALLVTLHRRAVDEESDLLYSDYAVYDLGQAVAHLTVQAGAMGLATHQFAAFDHDAMAQTLGVPPHWAVTTGIAVGRAGDGADAVREPGPAAPAPAGLAVGAGLRQRTRRPLCEFVFTERFGSGAGFACDGPQPGDAARG